MKKLFADRTKNWKWALLLSSSMFFIQSCTKDDTGDPSIPGSDRDKYVGSWLCKETYAGSASNTFTINIQKYGVDDTVLVYNFNNLGSSDYAIWLISGNSITIPNQDISVTMINVAGSGFYTNGKLNLSYTSDGDNVTAECTRP